MGATRVSSSRILISRVAGCETMGERGKECGLQDCDPDSKTCGWFLPVAYSVYRLLRESKSMEEWDWRCGARGCRCCQGAGT